MFIIFPPLDVLVLETVDDPPPLLLVEIGFLPTRCSLSVLRSLLDDIEEVTEVSHDSSLTSNSSCLCFDTESGGGIIGIEVHTATS